MDISILIYPAFYIEVWKYLNSFWSENVMYISSVTVFRNISHVKNTVNQETI